MAALLVTQGPGGSLDVMREESVGAFGALVGYAEKSTGLDFALKLLT